jgi:hypothetical protein
LEEAAMKRFSFSTGIALAALSAGLIAPLLVAPAQARGASIWDERPSSRISVGRIVRAPYSRYDRGLRYYNSPRAYRNVCGYGDCQCLRAMAVRTGNPTWWDKYQACSG